MIQEILVYIIIAAVVLKVAYSLYKSVTVKDKTVCGGCASCGGVKVKGEPKKNKLSVRMENPQGKGFPIDPNTVKYSH